MIRIFSAVTATTIILFTMMCSDDGSGGNVGVDSAQADSGWVFPETDWKTVEAVREGFDPAVVVYRNRIE